MPVIKKLRKFTIPAVETPLPMPFMSMGFHQRQEEIDLQKELNGQMEDAVKKEKKEKKEKKGQTPDDMKAGSKAPKVAVKLEKETGGGKEGPDKNGIPNKKGPKRPMQANRRSQGI